MDCGDHPRVCGEHTLNEYGRRLREGSSPRMRGTHSTGAGSYTDIGIIPAYAGNTAYMITPAITVWDHPRVCGEHIKRP